MFKDLLTALQWKETYVPSGKFILIKDTLQSDGSFLLHHFINTFLSNKKRTCLCSFNQTYFHYQSIQLKLVSCCLNLIF